MAVKNRVTSANLSKVSPRRNILEVEEENWLLSEWEFQEHIYRPSAIIIQRILCSHMKYFKDNFVDLVVEHIPHKYSSEMAKKSKIVSTSYISLS